MHFRRRLHGIWGVSVMAKASLIPVALMACYTTTPTLSIFSLPLCRFSSRSLMVRLSGQDPTTTTTRDYGSCLDVD